MSRKTDLEESIRESYSLIREYEDIIRLSADPRERMRSKREIERQRDLMEQYLNEYARLVGGAFPGDIAEIAAYFSVDLRSPPPKAPSPSTSPARATVNDTSPGMADLEIHIQPLQDAGYPVQITLNGQQQFRRGYLAADIVPWIPGDDPTADGLRLFDALIADRNLQSAWDRAYGRSARRRIRLWIDERAPELHTLPWELLREGEVMLSASASTPFSRYLPVDQPWGDSIQERPLRVLAAISDPTDLEVYGLRRLDVAAEQSVLENGFAGVPPADVELAFLEPPVTLERLETKLREGYHVFHYVGHGRFIPERDATVLYMQHEAGTTRPVTGEALTAMLLHQWMRPRLVCLAACQSAAGSSSDAFVGLGPRLVRAGVPAVIAMQASVTVETALKFTAALYRSLLRHRIVDRAMNEARRTLLTAGRWDAAVPVLFMRLKDGRL